MNKTATVLTLALTFAAGVLVAQTYADIQHEGFLKSIAAQCDLKDKSGYSARVTYNPQNGKFGCLRVPDGKSTWAMAPVFSHPLRGVTQ